MSFYSVGICSSSSVHRRGIIFKYDVTQQACSVINILIIDVTISCVVAHDFFYWKIVTGNKYIFDFADQGNDKINKILPSNLVYKFNCNIAVIFIL